MRGLLAPGAGRGKMSGKGVLYLCATPIGNLEDITLRALRVLKEVDLIAAEDTRHTKKLLNHYGIKKPLLSYHEHNRRQRGRELLSRLLAGQKIALVTDAGTPGISDPGAELVALAVAEGIPVVALPGPSAAITALVVSGLPTSSFCFEGFLPAARGARRRRLEELKKEKRTLIFYEAPHRLLETLADMLEVLGDRPVAVARELTKVHEEVWRGKLAGALEHFRQHPPRGEFTLVVGGAPPEDEEGSGAGLSPAAHVALLVEMGYSKKEAIKEVARQHRLPKRLVYEEVHRGEEK